MNSVVLYVSMYCMDCMVHNGTLNVSYGSLGTMLLKVTVWYSMILYGTVEYCMVLYDT